MGFRTGPWSLDAGGGKDEDWGLDGAQTDLSEVEVGSRWVTQMRVWKGEWQQAQITQGGRWLAQRSQARKWLDNSNDDRIERGKVVVM